MTLSVYREHGHELPLHEWEKTIGGYGISNFDAAEHLSHLTQLKSASLRARYRAEADALIHASPILPGVLDLINEAKQHSLKLAVASSSPPSWVDAHLARLGLLHHFERIICSDDVAPCRTKPNPDLFLRALEQLKVRNNEAIVFEDSPNGVKAARSAGIFVVAVPNHLTSRLKIEGADLVLRSLQEFSLDRLGRLR